MFRETAHTFGVFALFELQTPQSAACFIFNFFTLDGAILSLPSTPMT